MTDKEIEEIEARANRAHPAPWGIPPRRSNATKFWLQLKDKDGDWLWTWRGFVACDFEEDAEFVAHARSDVPALIAEIYRLKNVLRFMDQLDTSQEHWWPTCLKHVKDALAEGVKEISK
jgi:hypothetical protein